jgi:hypothetical protein
MPSFEIQNTDKPCANFLFLLFVVTELNQALALEAMEPSLANELVSHSAQLSVSNS